MNFTAERLSLCRQLYCRSAFGSTVHTWYYKAWQEWKQPPESSLLSLMSSSRGWLSGPPATSWAALYMPYGRGLKENFERSKGKRTALIPKFWKSKANWTVLVPILWKIKVKQTVLNLIFLQGEAKRIFLIQEQRKIEAKRTKFSPVFAGANGKWT